MTLLPSTIPLLLTLIAATLLGAGIGVCLWHLRLARRHRRSLERLQLSAEKERAALGAMLEQERDRAMLKLEELTGRARKERERADRAASRNEVLVARERERVRRVERLEADVLALEKRLAARGADASGEARDSPLVLRHRAFGEERLPVLRRRAGSASFDDGGSLALVAELARDERDIPPLAESELPDSVDDLVIELLDTGRADARIPERSGPDVEGPDTGGPDSGNPEAAGTGGGRDER